MIQIARIGHVGREVSQDTTRLLELRQTLIRNRDWSAGGRQQGLSISRESLVDFLPRGRRCSGWGPTLTLLPHTLLEQGQRVLRGVAPAAAGRGQRRDRVWARIRRIARTEVNGSSGLVGKMREHVAMLSEYRVEINGDGGIFDEG